MGDIFAGVGRRRREGGGKGGEFYVWDARGSWRWGRGVKRGTRLLLFWSAGKAVKVPCSKVAPKIAAGGERSRL